MLATCRAAMAAALAPLSLKAVLTEDKDGGANKARPYALLLWGDEELQRRRRRLGHTNDLAAGTRIIFVQVARRTVPLQVRLVADSIDAVDALVIQFLQNLPARVETPDSGPIAVALRGAETPPAEGLLRREAQWEGTVEFAASVVRRQTVKLFRLRSELTLEHEINV